jgi:hypothetical protein
MSIATEHLLDFVIGRQVSPSGTLFDDLPFLIGDVVIRVAGLCDPRERRVIARASAPVATSHISSNIAARPESTYNNREPPYSSSV